MNTRQITLWQLIEVLAALPSFTLDAIRYVIPIEFTERYRGASFSSYEGGPFRLADQVVLETAEFRIRHKDGASRLALLYLTPDGTCVTLDDVQGHFPDIVITDHPRGHSLDEKTYWSIQQSWGKLSFGFKERNPDCLASVVLERNEPLPASA